MSIIKNIKEIFDYRDGKIFWKQKSSPKASCNIGDEAGCLDKYNGRWKVCYNNIRYPRSYIVFALHHGRFPSPEIDHINRNQSDDRIENLREATRSENLKNRVFVNTQNMGHQRGKKRGPYKKNLKG
jgi:hypothetical protein